MTKVLNKGITEIQYNSLNLPKQMDIKSPVAEARNEYTYSAGGQKLKVVQKWNPNYSTTPVIGSGINTTALTQSKTTDYVGNKIYENRTLKRILIDGGYIEGNVYHYYLTDHLGNNRVVVNASGTLVQKNHYYPFGSIFAGTTGPDKQPYKYNGKELDQMHGLNLYDYSARYYESAVGRFTSVDPLAEKKPWLTPYHYCSNNPIKRVDPDGKWDIEVYASKDRGKSGYAVLILKDRKGKEVYRTVVKTIGTGGRKRNVEKSDTPQGEYKILGWRSTGKGTSYNRDSYGPNDLLALKYQGGEGGVRNGMHIHGGRQEGQYKGRTNLASTHGCMRINDNDISEMKDITSNLEENDPKEKTGVLTLEDELSDPVQYNEDRENAGLSQFPRPSSGNITMDIAPQLKVDSYNLVIPMDNTYVKTPNIKPITLQKD